MNKAVFDKNTEVYKSEPAGREDLAFQVRIPKNWEATIDANENTEGVSKNVFGSLVKFYSPGMVDARSSLTVEATTLEYEMSAEHWVLRYLLSRGLPSKGFNIISRDRADFFFVDVEGDTTFAVRAIAQRNGKTMLLARYAMPLSRAQKEAPLQDSVLSSFDILNPVTEDVEQMVEYRFLDLVSIHHPDSWSLRAPHAKSMDRMSVRLLNFNKNSYDKRNTSLEGKIEVNLAYYFAVDDLEQEQKAAIDSVIKLPLRLSSELDVTEFNMMEKLKGKIEDLDGYELKAYDVVADDGSLQNYEFWITTLEIADYYYIFTLLTPNRDDDFFTWSRNVETYNLVMTTIQPNLDVLIYEE